MKLRIINFEKQKGRKLYEQVYRKLQNDILCGYIKQGDQLPSIRQAVTLFHVSKTCIEQAYEALEMNGLVTSIPQKGFFVEVDEEHVKLRRQLIENVSQYEEEIIRYDFRSQSMDKNAFDITLWKKYLKEVLDHHRQITTYGDAQGERALRIALANYAYAMRGVLCEECRILVGASVQSLLYIVLGLMQRPCVFGMEKDSFLPAQMVCEDYQIPVQYLTCDEEGISMEALYKSSINVLYINSLAQGKKHQPIAKKRQKEVLEWAQKRNAYIIEDDHNGELRYQTRMMPAMQGYDGGKQVLYVGSFSRLLLPSLRISYLVLNEELYLTYLSRKLYYTPTSSKIEQLALAQYISDGHLERHVKKLRKHYCAKAIRMETLLKHYFSFADIHLEESSLCFIAKLCDDKKIDAWIKQAEKKQIQIRKSKANEVTISFAAIEENTMQMAIKELYEIYQNA